MRTKEVARPYPHFKFPHEIFISVKLLSDNECHWYNVPVGSYELHTDNYGWFPTEIIMGVIAGRFSDTYNIGATISGNMGSMNIAVKDKDKAIQLLKDAGYNVIDNL